MQTFPLLPTSNVPPPAVQTVAAQSNGEVPSTTATVPTERSLSPIVRKPRAKKVKQIDGKLGKLLVASQGTFESERLAARKGPIKKTGMRPLLPKTSTVVILSSQEESATTDSEWGWMSDLCTKDRKGLEITKKFLASLRRADIHFSNEEKEFDRGVADSKRRIKELEKKLQLEKQNLTMVGTKFEMAKKK